MTTLSPRLQPLFEKTRTVCFGHFLMQVPATATIVYGPAEVETPIEYFEAQGDKVAEQLAARLAEVQKERRFLMKNDFPRLPLFGKVIDGVMPGQKIVFGSKNQAGYAVHSFIPVGKDLFVQSIDSILPDEDVVNAINRVASRLRPRLEDEVPAEPGICIEAGFVPLQAKYERVPIGIRLKEFPDVHLSVDVHKNLDYLPVGSSPKLLREQAVEMAVAEGLGAVFARTKILRQNERLLGIWKGEEIALRTPAYKDALEAHEFREGGTRRLFKAGERMPHAVLLGEPGLWRNLTGSSRRQIQTIWKLVDYVDETATPPGAAGDAGSQASRPSDAPNVA